MLMVSGVVGGVDTHADVHVAAAVDGNGGVLGVESFPADAGGYEALVGWLVGFGRVLRVGVEGTGSYGVGLSRFLHDLDVDVVEVDRPNRQARRKEGKSDPVDAEAAARAALSGTAPVTPKRRDGAVEQMRVLLIARRSARRQRNQTLNQLRQVVITAPDEIRAVVQGAVDDVNAESARVRQLKKFVVLDDALSIESGELTPTLKVKRKVVREHFADEIEETYA